MVVEAELPREEQTPSQKEVVNCVPWPEVRMEGRPNRETQEERKAHTQDSAEIEANGVNSSQRVVRSIMVRRYGKPWLAENPQCSCRHRNRRHCRTNMCLNFTLLVPETNGHRSTSLERPGHTNLEEINL